MKEKNSWFMYLIVIIAIVALILAVIALAKINMTGKGIFEWFKKESTATNKPVIPSESKGLLGDVFVFIGGDKNSLKGYEVKYDENGNLIYEIVDGGTKSNLGPNYARKEINGNIIVYSLVTGNSLLTEVCGCDFPEGSSGSCTNQCGNPSGGQCPPSGKCTGTTCTATGCKIKERKED